MIEVLGSEGCRAMDRKTIEILKMPSVLLMENAVFSMVKHFYHLDDILIICGVGNNGGDGVALARHLYFLNKKVRVIVVGSLDKASVDFVCNYNILKNLNVHIILINKDDLNIKTICRNTKIIVDCLFGTGLTRNLNEQYIKIVESMNSSPAYKISIDVPSGLNCDTGEVMGASVKADKTITFQTMKRGFLNYKALSYLGEVIIEPIGIPESILKEVSEGIVMTERADISSLIPKRERFGYKSDYGRVAIIAGSEEYSGAAYLTAQAAVKTGSGLVNLYTHRKIRDSMRNKLNEAMVGVYHLEEEIGEKINSAQVVAIGPGLGTTPEANKLINWVITNYTGKIVIDADGLNVLASQLDILNKCKGDIIVTPHLGEMARLTGKGIDDFNMNRIDIAKEFSNKYGVTVLLKGLYTVIAGENRVYVNPTGNSSMASGGMGDTLTGIIASLIGQGINILDAAKLGSYIHGYIGERLSEEMYSVSATSIIEKIPSYLKELTGG
ncbi:NAD(P)H-hydrate dehydratase [Clostridium paridis]|uniref:Bifunctional NAD(P)H-hydrate repair enzyme n=1 Tax=Clostridium paridis TaxID=2803863 RepID=A0A937K4S0_9CLOT|nr:NAD(P)H-hydrate dehydratase [Clostridium paridis]MBL4931530.1 NAD(P)H-hydrate dehydratase [Clostridium paridis]